MVLITGDKGFVGSHLTKHIKDYVGFDLVDGLDTRNPYQVETVFENNQIDTVIHMAALAGVRKGNLFPNDYIDTNIKGTINIIEACKRHNVKHLIFFSSSSVYGNGNPPNKEEDALNPISIYGITKMAGEFLVKSSGIPYTIIRPFSLYGENGRKDQLLYKWLGQIKQGKPITLFGDGSAKREFTYVGEFVKGVLSILNDEPKNMTFNIAGNEVVTIKDMIDIFKEKLDFKIDNQPAPDEDIKLNWANTQRMALMYDYKPTTKFRDKVLEIIDKEI